MKLKSMGIGKRLALGYAAVVALFLAMVAITVWKVERVGEVTQTMEQQASQLSLAEKWLADVRQNSARSLAVARSSGRDMFDFFREAMAATSRSTTETQKAFLAAVTHPEGKRLADAVGEVRTQWLAARDEVNRLKEAGDDAAAQQVVTQRLVPMTDRYLQVTTELAQWQLGQVREARAQVESSFQALYLWIAATTLAALLLAAAQFGSWGGVGLVLLVFIIGQTVEGYIIYPRLLGDRVELHAVW